MPKKEPIPVVEETTNDNALPAMYGGYFQIAGANKTDTRTAFRGQIANIYDDFSMATNHCYAMLMAVYKETDDFKANVQVETEQGSVYSLQCKGTLADFFMQMESMAEKLEDITTYDMNLNELELAEDLEDELDSTCCEDGTCSDCSLTK